MIQPDRFLSVIIVNYNTGPYVVQCVRSLQKQKNIKLEIIVVDNASQDNSAELLSHEFGDAIKLILANENLGFGRANNLGVSKANGEYLLILNPDTVIPEPLALSNLIYFLDGHPQIGILGPAIEEPRKSRHILPRVRYPFSQKLKFTTAFKALPGSIAWILGACMLLRRNLYNEISGFDPDYFLYGEDADICLRARQHGYEIGYCKNVLIHHVSGASEIGSDSLDKWLRKKRGVFLFLTKHFDRRDVLRVAKSEILKSKLYLLGARLKAMLWGRSQVESVDKLNRYRATIMVAEAVINDISTS